MSIQQQGAGAAIHPAGGDNHQAEEIGAIEADVPMVDAQVEGNDEGDLIVEQRKLVVEKSDRGLGELYKWFQRGNTND